MRPLDCFIRPPLMRGAEGSAPSFEGGGFGALALGMSGALDISGPTGGMFVGAVPFGGDLIAGFAAV